MQEIKVLHMLETELLMHSSWYELVSMQKNRNYY